MQSRILEALSSELFNWSRKKRNEIFVIEGPSKIGKTHFIMSHLNDYRTANLYIDVKKHERILNDLLNDEYVTPDNFYASLCFRLDKTPDYNLKLLIFDGIEYCPKIRQFFKSLVELNYLNIVAITCGGLGPMHYKKMLIPSEENVHRLMPLNFIDFLYAIGKSQLAAFFRQSLLKKEPLSKYLSQELYKHFKTYNLVGGYPGTIEHYLKTRDLHGAISLNKALIKDQFKHAMYFFNEDDQKILSLIFDNMNQLLFKQKYNSINSISAYKMKQILTFLEEEMIINIVEPMNLANLSDQSGGKEFYLSHQCFCYAFSNGLDVNSYFNNDEIEERIVLTDFFFNQKNNGKPLKYALIKDNYYLSSDGLIVNNMSSYIVEIKSKRTSVEINNRISKLSNGFANSGVLLLNDNKFIFGETTILPSYCSCVLNELFS